MLRGLYVWVLNNTMTATVSVLMILLTVPSATSSSEQWVLTSF